MVVEMGMVENIREALDEALLEADEALRETKADRHVWCGPVTEEDGNWRGDCVAHSEGQYCCLDADHGGYDKLLDYLAGRICQATMYRGGAVTNVVATMGREIQPEPVGDGLRKYDEVGIVDRIRAETETTGPGAVTRWTRADVVALLDALGEAQGRIVSNGNQATDLRGGFIDANGDVDKSGRIP
jgi:hypothetical protein